MYKNNKNNIMEKMDLEHLLLGLEDLLSSVDSILSDSDVSSYLRKTMLKKEFWENKSQKEIKFKLRKLNECFEKIFNIVEHKLYFSQQVMFEIALSNLKEYFEKTE